MSENLSHPSEAGPVGPGAEGQLPVANLPANMPPAGPPASQPAVAVQIQSGVAAIPVAPGAFSSIEPTPVERLAGAAYDQASAAADALRRGEFSTGSVVDPTADNDDRLIAMLCYISQIFVPVLMPLIVLLSESSKKRPFQRYHAVQSLAFTLTLFGLGVATFIVSTIIGFIPLVGFLVILMAICLTGIGYVAAVIAMLYYGFQAYAGKRFGIPGLTTLLQDQGWLK